MKRGLAIAWILLAGWTPVAEAFRPSGWIYGLDGSVNYLYCNTSGRWHFVNPSTAPSARNMTTGTWWKLELSALRSGWSFWQWPYAYCASNGAWYFIAGESTPWVHDMTGQQWSLLGVSSAGQFESRIHALVNAHRASNGRAALVHDNGIAAVARQHSRNAANGSISQSQFLAHEGFQSGTNNRVQQIKAFLAICSWGENVGYRLGMSDPPQSQFDGWKNSSGHNANMLNANFNRTGIGAAQAANGTWYFTQIFARSP